MTPLDRLGRRLDLGLDDALDQLEHMFQQNLRIGVTGLARAGKTVFITSLLRNLLHRDRMAGLQAVAEGRIEAARLNPQPDLTLPRFPYEGHLNLLAGGEAEAHWPPGTTNISRDPASRSAIGPAPGCRGSSATPAACTWTSSTIRASGCWT